MRATARLHGHAAVGAACLLLALLLRRAELVAVAAPFLSAVAFSLATARRGRLQGSVRLERERAVEGDRVRLEISLRSDVDIPRLDLHLPLPAGLRTADPDANGTDVHSLSLRAGVACSVTHTLRCERFGAHHLDAVRLRTHDALSMLVHDGEIRIDRVLRVYPREQMLGDALRPRHTQLRVGNRRSPALGSGVEFAGTRPFAPGDRPRQVNWAVSTRRDMLHVNEQHPERNADVVLLLDTFAEVGEGGHSTLSLGVQAVAALATHFLGERDRVGVAGYGGMVRWLRPGMGRQHRQRILDALLDTQVSLHYAFKGIDVVPPRLLPPRALVVVVSPLVDERMVTVVADLRRRRYDVAVLEVSPVPFTSVGGGATDGLAHRVWLLEREALRRQLMRRGVAVAEWRPEQPLVRPLEEMGRFRRFATTARS